VLADARIDLLRARADEELTLIARGNDPSFDGDFTAMMADVQGSHGLLRRALAAPVDDDIRADIAAIQTDLIAWQHEDVTMRAANTGGQYQTAVIDTVGPTNDDAPALFATLDDRFGIAIDASDATFQAQSAAAARALADLTAEVGVLIAIALLGLTIGFQRRIAEYR
jgi:hypothetical protein